MGERSLELWSEENAATIVRARDFVQDVARAEGVYGAAEQVPWMPPHVIDLSADGAIGAHVDSVKFSGGIVAGLSLISTRHMSFAPCKSADGVEDASLFKGAGPEPVSAIEG